jgi:glutamine amidotransferase
MCLLSYYPDGVQPVCSELECGATLNNDGHGYAIVTEGSVIIGKGFKADEVISEFAAMRRRYPDGPALFHSRLATDGAETLDNVHPFYVNNDRRTVLAHNGIMPTRPSKGDPRSDTRLFADSFGGRFGSIRKQTARDEAAKWMGSWNKVVILTADPRSPARAFILNEKSGEWTENGIWYSNEGYQGYRWSYTSGGSYGGSYGSHGAGWYKWNGKEYSEFYPDTTAQEESTVIGYPDGGTATNAGRKWWDDLSTCRFCFSIMSNVETELGWCENCDTCQDCDQTTDNCQCYYRAVRSVSKGKELEPWTGDGPYALS